MDLKETWTGKAIFTDAFLRVIPGRPRDETTRLTSPLADPMPRPTKARAAPIRRGSGFSYINGPSRLPLSRYGTWRSHMVSTILANTNSHDAEQAHANSGLYTDMRLDFSWMLSNNYITKVQT